MSSEKINFHKKDNNKSPSLICLGSSLNLELTLSLEEKQYESIGINYKEISKLNDLKNLFRYQSSLSPLKKEKLASLIELKSNNFLFNSILFINQSSRKKIPIKYHIPFSPKFSKDLNFIYDITRLITETNNISIEDSNLLDINPKIVFTLKLIDSDNTIDQKSFLITNENHYNSNNFENKKEDKSEKEKNRELFDGLNFNYDCDYFYTSTSELFDSKVISGNEIDIFFKKLINKYPDIKICINYDGNYSLDKKNDILKLINITDIFIFEKKDVINFYNNSFNINNQKMEEKKEKTYLLEDFFIYKVKSERNSQKIKIGIFINSLKEIYLIQQEPKTNLILFHSNNNINIIPAISNEYQRRQYDELISLKYNSIKSVYVGAFLNRLIREESFEVCLKTSLKCCTKYLNIIKFGLDVPSIQNYYEIKNAKFHKKKISKEEIKNKQLENQFVLDCTNLTNKKSLYNSLYDENCVNFFNSKEIRKHLQKQGFINKKGMILIDPDKSNDKFLTMSKKEKKEVFRKFQNKIRDVKEIRKNNDNRLEKLNQISLINKHALKDYNYKDFDTIKSDYNTDFKHFYLPKIKNKNIIMNKSPNIFNKFENLYGENNKEDLKGSVRKKKKNLSEININIKNFRPKYSKIYDA